MMSTKPIESLPGDVKNLPVLPKSVGEDIDFMIGIKYLRYHPKAVFQLPSGLTIYKSMFENADGGYGVIGGPHQVFTAIEKHFRIHNNHHQSTFFSNQFKLYIHGYQVNPDLSVIGNKGCNFNINDKSDGDVYVSQRIKLFNASEGTGSDISYRCVKCRTCSTCKDHDEI